MVDWEGFEPPTSALPRQHSYQLNYQPTSPRHQVNNLKTFPRIKKTKMRLIFNSRPIKRGLLICHQVMKEGEQHGQGYSSFKGINRARF